MIPPGSTSTRCLVPVEESYAGAGRPRQIVKRLVRGNAVVGLYGPDGRQLGFARAVSDGIAFAYLADVYVHPEARGHGLDVELVREMVELGRSPASSGSSTPRTRTGSTNEWASAARRGA